MKHAKNPAYATGPSGERIYEEGVLHPLAREGPGNSLNVNTAIDKVNKWHQALAEFVIEFPTASWGEIAAHFGVSPGWISRVINSDAFRAYHGEMVRAHQSEAGFSVVERAESLAHLSLSALEERVTKEREELETRDLREIAFGCLKSLGYGGSQSATTAVAGDQVTHITVQANVLHEAKERIAARGAKSAFTPPALSPPNGQTSAPAELSASDED